MGNSHTKEARDPNAPLSPHDPRSHASGHHASGSSSSRPRNRASRSDLGGLFGISAGSSSSTQPPYERRETKQEREARKLERERQARLIERERSLKEEHVDGGYLVTLGTYVGTEDFNKAVVRQLQVIDSPTLSCFSLGVWARSKTAGLMADALYNGRSSEDWRHSGEA